MFCLVTECIGAFDVLVMSTKRKVNSAKGKRYTPAEKAEVVAFVEKVNAEKGRGGQSAASAKFKISQLTISSWLKGSKGAAPAKVGRPKGTGAKVGRPKGTGAKVGRPKGTGAKVGRPKGTGAKVGSVKGGFTSQIAKLSALAAQIDSAEAALGKLKAEFAVLKRSL